MMFPECVSRFNAYADTFRAKDGSLPDTMRCKLEHTFDVVRFAEIIARGEGFPDQETFLAQVCALFHDIARFEQVKRFSTFNDHLSKFDHGYEATRILLAENLLQDFLPGQRIAILAAVEFHNKIGIPDGICGTDAIKFAKITRDADKLAILELVVRFLRGEIKLEDDSIIALSQANGTGVNPEIIANIRAQKPCAYKLIRNMNDFLTCLFSWVPDLNFASSAAKILEHEFYGNIRTFLPEEPVFDELLNQTRSLLKCRSSK